VTRASQEVHDLSGETIAADVDEYVHAAMLL